jgi:hypothetical protein
MEVLLILPLLGIFVRVHVCRRSADSFVFGRRVSSDQLEIATTTATMDS